MNNIEKKYSKLSEQSEQGASFSAENERQTIPDRVSTGILLNGGEKIRESWSSENAVNYTLSDYVSRMKESSGHFAVHAIPRPDLLLKCIERGYIKATGLEEDKPADYMAAESQAVHFSVDQVYWRSISQGGFFCAVEALLENKTFMDSPFKEKSSPNEDWPLGGFSEDVTDETNKFYINDLGILILPKEINESLNQQCDMISGEPIKTSWVYNLRAICKKFNIEEEFFPTKATIVLPTTSFPLEQILRRVFEKISISPKRVYFYNHGNLEEGIKQFIQEFDLQQRENIIVSGSIELAKKNIQEKSMGGKGMGDFYAVRK